MSLADLYGPRSSTGKRTVLDAERIVEQSAEDQRVVPLLQALPWEEAQYYAKESNVVQQGAVSSILFAEATQRYGFVEGSQVEYDQSFRWQT